MPILPRTIRSSRPHFLLPPHPRHSPHPTSPYSTQLARKRPDPTAPPPQFRYSGFTPFQSFALSFLTIFGAGALGYTLSSLLESQGLHLFSPSSFTNQPHLTPLNLDPHDENITGPGTYRPMHGSKRGYEAAINALRNSFEGLGRGEDVSTDEGDLRAHGVSEWSYHEAKPASVVVWAESIEDIKRVVEIARKYKVPITPFSGGTSLEGHFSSPYAGISLDLSRMDKILQINEQDGDVVVEPGVKWEDLNAELKRKGIPLFFPLDPGPGATIGGMMATACSGTNAVRYGTMRGEWVLNATVILPNGDIIKTRQRSRKSSAGWDATKLFIGSEGTLGIVVQATLKLAPLLPSKVAVVNFDTGVEAAVSAATEVVTAGLPVQCVEFLDASTMKAINLGGLAGRQFPEKDTLFFKVQGSDASMEEISESLKLITKKHGGRDFEFAKTEAEAEAAWQGRKAALWSVQALKENGRVWTTDVCVPISKIPKMVQETSADALSRGLTACHFGHVGDGNVHSLFVFENEEELERIKVAVEEMVHRAIEMDGTCSGEHSLGMGKTKYLKKELGEDTVRFMETIKRTIDPDDIFNPGKIYEDIKPQQMQ